MTEDVNYGYNIPIPPSLLPKIQFMEVYPLGIQHQSSIDEAGNTILKDWVSHDLSFPKDNLAINNR
eukprot:3110910-Ditylum_brightwellii.AAC.1